MRKKNFRFPKGVSGSVSKSENDHFGMSNFFLLKKKLIIVFFGWNSLEITLMLQSFQHYFGITVKIRKIRIFHRFFYFWPWSRNNYVMIPTTSWFPVNFTPKNYTIKLNFEKKKFSIPERGLRFGFKIGKRPFWDVGRNFFFFLWKKKLITVFIGVEFTGDYRDVAIISTLFRDHSQNSKNPNFSSFFLLLTVITK